MISKCVETFGFENPNLMEPIDFNITTEAPYDDDLLNNENFPNYQDFPQKYYMNIDTVNFLYFTIIYYYYYFYYTSQLP